MGKKSRRKKPGAVRSNQPAAVLQPASVDCDKECQANDFSHHAKCCPVLARRWDGAGSMPLKLFDLFAEGKWKDPAVLPSARARERVREMDEGMDRFIDEYASEEGSGGR